MGCRKEVEGEVQKIWWERRETEDVMGKPGTNPEWVHQHPPPSRPLFDHATGAAAGDSNPKEGKNSPSPFPSVLKSTSSPPRSFPTPLACHCHCPHCPGYEESWVVWGPKLSLGLWQWWWQPKGTFCLLDCFPPVFPTSLGAGRGMCPSLLPQSRMNTTQLE